MTVDFVKASPLIFQKFVPAFPSRQCRTAAAYPVTYSFCLSQGLVHLILVREFGLTRRRRRRRKDNRTDLSGDNKASGLLLVAAAVPVRLVSVVFTGGQTPAARCIHLFGQVWFGTKRLSPFQDLDVLVSLLLPDSHKLMYVEQEGIEKERERGGCLLRSSFFFLFWPLQCAIVFRNQTGFLFIPTSSKQQKEGIIIFSFLFQRWALSSLSWTVVAPFNASNTTHVVGFLLRNCQCLNASFMFLSSH